MRFLRLARARADALPTAKEATCEPCGPHYGATMIGPAVGRCQANSLRLTLAVELGHEIDGAWWPHADRITNELPNLVAVLTPLLGDIHLHQCELVTAATTTGPQLAGVGAQAPARNDAPVAHIIPPICSSFPPTHSALAIMLMRCAANLPIDVADRAKLAFQHRRLDPAGSPTTTCRSRAAGRRPRPAKEGVVEADDGADPCARTRRA